MPKHAAHKARVSETVARPTRTGLQYAAGWALAVWLNPHLPHLVDHQRIVLAGLLAAAVSAALVAVENHLGVGLLRQVPPTTAPVVDDKETP